MNSQLHNFSQVLFIGPQFENHRGGIGAVLDTYRQHADEFKFLPSYDARFGRMKNNGLFLITLFRLFFKLLLDRQIKIVHIHGASKGSFYRKYLVFLLSKYVFRKKLVYHLHSGEFHIFYEKSGSYIKKRIHHLAENVDLFICLSNHWYQFLSTHFKPKKLIILNNPVELPAIPKNLVAQNPVTQFLYLGLIVNKKGIFDLLEVITQNKKVWNHTFQLIIGGDGQNERLKTIIKENGLSEIVKFEGWVNGDKKAALLDQCDVLILPSYNEGLPISILEAMANRKAILSTRVGGIPAVVQDGENGYLFEPGNKNELETKMNLLLENPNQVLEMGKSSFIKVQPYLANYVMKELEEEYKVLSKI